MVQETLWALLPTEEPGRFKMQRAMTHPGFTTQFGVFSGPSSKSTRTKAIHVQL